MVRFSVSCAIPPYLVNLGPQAPQPPNLLLFHIPNPILPPTGGIGHIVPIPRWLNSPFLDFFGLFPCMACSLTPNALNYYLQHYTMSPPLYVYTNTEHPAFCILYFIVSNILYIFIIKIKINSKNGLTRLPRKIGQYNIFMVPGPLLNVTASADPIPTYRPTRCHISRPRSAGPSVTGKCKTGSSVLYGKGD